MARTPTVLKGQITDPAGLNPLYNIVVYVPNTTPSALTHGQPSCDSCSSLYTGDPIVSTTTDTDGNFTLTERARPLERRRADRHSGRQMAPAVGLAGGDGVHDQHRDHGGRKVSPPARPGVARDPVADVDADDLPQIAVSTGSADTMECLFKRIGFAASEYVCGWNAGAGHLHVFQGGGGQGGNTVTGCTASQPGVAVGLGRRHEQLRHRRPLLRRAGDLRGRPREPARLHAGRRTRVHVALPLFVVHRLSEDGNGNPAYAAPTDWGNNLATWYPASNDICPTGTSANNCANTQLRVVDQREDRRDPPDGGTPFDTWLTNVNALGVVAAGGSGTAVAGELNIQQSRMNAAVAAANAAVAGLDRPRQRLELPLQQRERGQRRAAAGELDAVLLVQHAHRRDR